MLELWKTWTLLERLLVQEEHQRWFEGKHRSRRADAHNLDSKPSIVEPEVEIDEFNMTSLNVDALQESEKVRGSEWIKVGVDTGAGKTAWPQSITYGTTIPGGSDLTFRTATAELVKRWQANANCGLRRLGIQSQNSRCSSTGVQTTVVCWRIHDKRWSHCVCMVTKVTCSTKVRMLQRRFEAWVQKELRFSQYRGCTVAYKENNVYNIYMKPRENKIDAMPLSGDSESEGCQLGPNL